MIFLLGYTGSIYAQQAQKKFLLDFSVSIGSGWWTYYKGIDENGIDRGWDRADTSPIAAGEIGFLARFGKVKPGVFIGIATYFQDEMDASDLTQLNWDQYPIGDKFVNFLKFGGQLEIDILEKKSFTLSPNLKAGSFYIDTVHPEKENFGSKYFFEIGIKAEKEFSKFSLYILPRGSFMTIQPQMENAKGELHKIYGYGVNIGARLNL
ncbi:hypothetical protein [Flexithrix dorotheae]|uniref:hypothetical protein n=1 Tax=Flexithrix dorotheae TaxID=70993 RepID=UPI0005C716BF|nr:hypothetical protein [Flexithrix dorotheae]